MLEIALKQIPTEIATARLTLWMTLKKVVEHGDRFGILLFGKCGLGILWERVFSSINKVRKPLTDIHVAVAISEVNACPHQCLWHLLSSRGVGCFVLCSLIIDNIDAFVAGRPRNVVTA